MHEHTPFDHLVGGEADSRIGSFINRWIPLWITPNIISSVRLALIPIVIVRMLDNAWGDATALFVIGMALDLFDGPLARARGQVSHLGKLLDPLADKACVLIPFWVWSLETRADILALWIMIALGIVLTVIELRLLLPRIWSFLTRSTARSSNNHGKAKVWYQGFMVGILLLEPHAEFSILLALMCGSVALHLAVWSVIGARKQELPAVT